MDQSSSSEEISPVSSIEPTSREEDIVADFAFSKNLEFDINKETNIDGGGLEEPGLPLIRFASDDTDERIDDQSSTEIANKFLKSLKNINRRNRRK